MGGEEAFIERLDVLFKNKLYYAGNEPGFMLPYLYNYVNRYSPVPSSFS